MNKIALVAIIDVLLAALPFLFLETIADVLFKGNSTNAIASMLPILFVILAFQFSCLLMSTEKKISNQLQSIFEKIEGSEHIEALTQEEFYPHFRDNVLTAESSVDIAFLDKKAPNKYGLKTSATYKYYKKFSNLIKDRDDIYFRRVELYHPDKIEWIDKLVKDFSGCRNFSLVLLRPKNLEDKLPHTSVQIIDNSKTYCCGVAQHESLHGECRDMYIVGEKSSNIWRSYYEQHLWNAGTKVISNGTVEIQKWQEIKGGE